MFWAKSGCVPSALVLRRGLVFNFKIVKISPVALNTEISGTKTLPSHQNTIFKPYLDACNSFFIVIRTLYTIRDEKLIKQYYQLLPIKTYNESFYV